MNIVIGIGGDLESGKDTAADFIIKLRKNYKKLHFAENLKRMCMVAFNLSEHDVYTEEGKKTPFAEPKEFTYEAAIEICHWAKNVNDFPDNGYFAKVITLANNNPNSIYPMREVFRTPREILQYVGTEVCRECIFIDYHVDVVRKQMYRAFHDGYNVVIADMRFENERDFVSMMGGKKLVIRNPELNKGHIGITGHKSENSLGPDGEYDHVINNTKDGFDIYEKKVKDFLSLMGV